MSGHDSKYFSTTKKGEIPELKEELNSQYKDKRNVVLAEKPVISDNSNQFEPSLLDELLANIATLSSVYHKPPESFVTRVRNIPKTEEEFPEITETGYSDIPTARAVIDATPLPTIVASPYALGKLQSPAHVPAPDLLDLGFDGDDSSAVVPLDQPMSPSGPPLPVLLPAANGQGLQISAQLVRRNGKIFYSLMFENNTETPLDGFMIQFNKNTFGLAASGPLQVPLMQPGKTEKTLVPMVLWQNMAQGPPNSLLQVAVKNNQQPVWYLKDKVSLLVLFVEDGKMERGFFLETWRSLPDSNEVSKHIPDIVISNVEATKVRLASSNIFFIGKRKNENQEILYFSAKIPRGTSFLIELTSVVGSPGLKCAIKTTKPEMGPLFFEALETLLRS